MDDAGNGAGLAIPGAAERAVERVEHAGGIVEQGTHTQLLAAGGAYQHLYAAQFSGAVTDEQDEELEAVPVP